MTAIGAFEQKSVALAPQPRAASRRAGWRTTPPRLNPIGAAVVLGGEFLLDLDRRLREIPPQIVSVPLGHDPTPCAPSPAWDFAGTKGIGMNRERDRNNDLARLACCHCAP